MSDAAENLNEDIDFFEDEDDENGDDVELEDFWYEPLSEEEQEALDEEEAEFDEDTLNLLKSWRSPRKRTYDDDDED
jgi:hypothetical protein